MDLADFLVKGVMHHLTRQGLLGRLLLIPLSRVKGRDVRSGLRQRPRLYHELRYLLEGLNSAPLWKLDTLVLRPRE